MMEFINPNWHVVMLHYPIALVTLGVLIELFSSRRPDSTARRSGRWMLLFGGLLAVPAATAGIYAFRDVVARGAIDLSQTWSSVAAQSGWTDEQWHLMRNHILYNSIGTVL